MRDIIEELNKIGNLKCNLINLKNNFFGENVTVAGLITGNDLINQLKDKDIKILLSRQLSLRPFSEDFLDNVTVSEVQKTLSLQYSYY